MISLLRYPGGKFYMLEDFKEIFDKSEVVYNIMCKYKPPVTNEMIIK